MDIAVAQSGGPTCAINSSLMGVFKQALKSAQIDKIYGSKNGIEGILNNELICLNTAISSEDDIRIIKQTPSSVLGSCRFKLPDFEIDSKPYEIVLKRFEEMGIGAFFYIGGNDSMDTVAKLSAYFKSVNADISVMGIPKTIDNDLCFTDHTPGFGSAAKFVATTIKEITRDNSVYFLDSVIIVEIMGRNAGWLAASSCVLHSDDEVSPHLIYLPECEFLVDEFINDLKDEIAKHKTVIVVVSEGISVGDTSSEKTDAFGHKDLAGVGKKLENIVKQRLGCKVRSIELNVLQRCSSHIASKNDIEEAEEIGAAAVISMLQGETGKMMCFKREADSPYKITIQSVDAASVANKEKLFPLEWINEKQNNVKNEAIIYFTPLISGEQEIEYKNGIPVHFKL